MAFLAAVPAAIGSFIGNIGLGTAVQIGSAGLAGLSAIQAGNYQASVAKNNAVIAEENAARASEAAQRNQISADQELAALAGQQEAVQSASGLNVSGRSQVLARRNTQRVGRQDALNIVDAGQADARNFQQQAANFRGEARQAKRSGVLNAVSSGLGAYSSYVSGASPTRSTTANRYRNNRIPLPNGRWTTWRPA